MYNLKCLITIILGNENDNHQKNASIQKDLKVIKKDKLFPSYIFMVNNVMILF